MPVVVPDACTPPETEFLAETSAWAAISPGADAAHDHPAGHDGEPHGPTNLGGGVHLEIGAAVGNCLTGAPGKLGITLTGDFGGWDDGGAVGGGGLAVEQSVAEIAGQVTLGLRVAVGYGDKYTPLSDYLALGSYVDLEAGVRVRAGSVKLGLDAFYSPARGDAGSVGLPGLVFSVGATEVPGRVLTGAVATVLAIVALVAFHELDSRAD